MPMAKVAVSTGYKHFGLLFWQLAIMIVFLFVYQAVRGRLVRFELKHIPIITAIALLGAVIPQSFSYYSFTLLPAGFMAVIIATVPIFALPIAAILGLEKLVFRRALGVLIGLGAVILLVGPQEALPTGVKVSSVFIALIAPFCYSCEDNTIAKIGLSGLGPVQALFGASILGFLLIVPITFATGQFVNPIRPWGAAEFAFLGSTFFHLIAYTAFIWFIGVAGPVFASMVAYLVTGFGIASSAIFLGEHYSPYFWIAVVVMALGIFLVSPRADEGHKTADA